MADEFQLNILTPGKELFSGPVSELLLPSHDGESGILPGHANFIGLLGTGPLKLVQQGDDYWFMVSAGVYEIRGGEVTILAEAGEAADAVDLSSAQQEEQRLEPLVAEKSFFDADFDQLSTDYARAKARIEVYRRTHLVN